MFEIFYAKSVAKDIKRVDGNTLHKIKKNIEGLKNFPDISNIKKLSAHPLADFRLRVGEYRILFDVDWNEKIIFILKIGHRKDVY
ncbi:MAG: type II toxin-antitoxin system RelE/ParE family toxin [Desulfobacteraceae bacterium]|nr:type II toxin-antitoxin system RelE/ParE family toxin [Desulfobacteraceae bacterium]MBC2756773.1 type II toxin-antitoxin system RelE/ParE family toxin [Desulfobacteraceae bacterium]